MKEIWHTALNPTCLPATLLLGVVLLYWILGLLGIAGSDDGGADSHDDASSDGGENWVGEITGAMLRMLNAKGIPFMVVISILVIFLWGCMVWGFMILPKSLPLFSLWLSLGSLVAALILTSIVAMPLKPLYEKIRFDDEPHIPVIGRVGKVRSNSISTTFGQVEIPDASGPMFINARLSEDHPDLEKGSEVIVISLDKEKLVYTVRSTQAL